MKIDFRKRQNNSGPRKEYRVVEILDLVNKKFGGLTKISGGGPMDDASFMYGNHEFSASYDWDDTRILLVDYGVDIDNIESISGVRNAMVVKIMDLKTGELDLSAIKDAIIKLSKAVTSKDMK